MSELELMKNGWAGSICLYPSTIPINSYNVYKGPIFIGFYTDVQLFALNLRFHFIFLHDKCKFMSTSVSNASK